ncbi:Pet54p NDAI_0D02450 [Naumovozyma dairenensis CBS 421]|uniref:Uncharacterized protein n=1 Tax=Naumovozyma dairenensis (strain ATCC 10597 / BCRC 20456 / CBS 421 / NBRC 0211 / NRRL Y-12639) TaxID=1071378 RepID=G0W9U8_NAUDC|nr:hypothetical protein NDAI_0D02450 [Naumovozyma dairenensis CBS 421]CCD24559.1 hypothetical protein NDAI_0D02450 [Naumovozyma dairenensis CBS 421]
MSKNVEIIDNVLKHLKTTGKIVGTTPALKYVIDPGNRSRILKFQSYNPSLTHDDFVSLIPSNIFSENINGLDDKSKGKKNDDQFLLIKKRDPKYFQFKDQYNLIFRSYNSLREYRRETQMSKLNKIRVNFKLPNSNFESVSILENYQNYIKNLSNAYDSMESYRENLSTFEKFPLDTPEESTISTEISKLRLLQDKIKAIESKSLLVWHLPTNLTPTQIRKSFWLYAIKHCFPLYWNNSNSLYYFAFDNVDDAKDFRRNFHGISFNTWSSSSSSSEQGEDESDFKMLIEQFA